MSLVNQSLLKEARSKCHKNYSASAMSLVESYETLIRHMEGKKVPSLGDKELRMVTQWELALSEYVRTGDPLRARRMARIIE